MYYKQLSLDGVSAIIMQNNQGQGRDYQPKPKAETDKRYRDLDYSNYHKKDLIIVSLYIERKQNVTHAFASSLTASNTKRANLT